MVFRALEANAEGGFVKAECPLYDSRTHGLTCLLGAPLYSARCFGHTVRVSPRRFGGEAQRSMIRTRVCCLDDERAAG